jgi:hypothetical protein
LGESNQVMICWFAVMTLSSLRARVTRNTTCAMIRISLGVPSFEKVNAISR